MFNRLGSLLLSVGFTVLFGSWMPLLLRVFPAHAQEQSAPEFKNKLRNRKLICYAQTEVDYADQVFVRIGFCSTQRVLSETGWQQSHSRDFNNYKYRSGMWFLVNIVEPGRPPT